MKAIILAAGTGSRLHPYTKDRPKCMVPLQGTPLLQYQRAVLRSQGIEDISIVAGYLSEKIPTEGNQIVLNPKFDKTNMVTSLFCAREIIESCETDLLICYSDILYEPEVIQAITKAEAQIAVTIDKNWKEYWKLRMPNPLDDAETLILNEKQEILELGKKATSYEQIQGQYMGLFKIAAASIQDFCKFYDQMDRDKTYDGKDFPNMYMTSFLQNLIDHQWTLKAVPVEGGWLEVDTVEDLELYEKMEKEKSLKQFCDLSKLI